MIGDRHMYDASALVSEDHSWCALERFVRSITDECLNRLARSANAICGGPLPTSWCITMVNEITNGWATSSSIVRTVACRRSRPPTSAPRWSSQLLLPCRGRSDPVFGRVPNQSLPGDRAVR